MKLRALTAISLTASAIARVMHLTAGLLDILADRADEAWYRRDQAAPPETTP